MRHRPELPPHMQAAATKAEAERKLCKDWLLGVMRVSPKKDRTKADLRAEAMARFKVSKSSFDAAWNWAILETGNEDWYEPLRRPKKTFKPAALH
jgi:hypothetical protein